MTMYVRNQQTVSGQIDDNLVMMDIAKGSYFSLNSVGTRIWQLLETPLTAEALCNLLLAEYDVSPDQCRAEVSEHLSYMQQLSLVEIVA